MTDADGLGCITINSTVTGSGRGQRGRRLSGEPLSQAAVRPRSPSSRWTEHNYDWEDQPYEGETGYKTWIPHVIGGDDEGPITPTYAVNNTGEVEEFVLELKDVYGNPIPGYTVEWWIQGVGFFKTDGSTWVGIGEQNKDIDVTDADGMANVWLKSLKPGQTIVHCKVMDKYGLPWKEWNVVKQWYSIDRRGVHRCSGPARERRLSTPRPMHPENVVGTGHSFTA